MPDQTIPATHADRRTTPQRVTAAQRHERDHRERLAVRRALAALTRQHARPQEATRP